MTVQIMAGLDSAKGWRAQPGLRVFALPSQPHPSRASKIPSTTAFQSPSLFFITRSTTNMVNLDTSAASAPPISGISWAGRSERGGRKEQISSSYWRGWMKQEPKPADWARLDVYQWQDS